MDKVLDGRLSPSVKVNERDNRGTHFYKCVSLVSSVLV